MNQFFVKITDTWKTKNPEWKHILWDKENAQFDNSMPIFNMRTKSNRGC
jgi:hypothetical protein